MAYWRESTARGKAPDPAIVETFHLPGSLIGRAGFDTALDLLGSKVEPVVADFMETDLESLGTFDVVFYLGVLYHMLEPLTALKRLAMVTKELAIIETAAIHLPEREHESLCICFLKVRN